jgi:hypothetical protein
MHSRRSLPIWMMWLVRLSGCISISVVCSACAASGASRGPPPLEVVRNDLERCLSAVERVPVRAAHETPALLARLNTLAATAQGKCTLLPAISRAARSHRSGEALVEARRAVATIENGLRDFQQYVGTRAVGSPFFAPLSPARHELRLGAKLAEYALSELPIAAY